MGVYALPSDPARPLICVDEGGKQLQRQVREPQSARPGQPAKEDYTYGRNGAANFFMVCAPHLGWRQAWSTETRTAHDFAHAIRRVIDEWFPAAEKIVLVTDNLNTHTKAAFYATFPPAEAHRLVSRLEWHYTPKHGSWLNMAELELAVLARQCLNRRIPDQTTLDEELQAWCDARNTTETPLRWTYTIDDARRTMVPVYPILQQDS